MGRYLDLARRALEASAGALDGEKSEKSEKREIRLADPYQDLARAMLAKLTDQPVGMVPWLRQNYQGLYEELIIRLPDEIHSLWEEQAPLTEFEHILDLWLVAHRTACEIFRKERQ